MKSIAPCELRHRSGPLVLIFLVGLATTLQWRASGQELAHRWSFDDPNDSVGAATVELVGAAELSGGKLMLPGGAARTNYAQLPIGETIAASGSLSVETWFATTTSQNWSKAWMFGTEAPLSFIDFTPFTGVAGNFPSSSFQSPNNVEINTRGEPNAATLAAGVTIHAVSVFDESTNQIRIYLDGVEVDSGGFSGSVSELGSTSQNFIGAAVFFNDPDFFGTVDEMRVWKGALGADQVAANFAAGTGTVAPHDPNLGVASVFRASNNGSSTTISIPIRNLGSASSLVVTEVAVSGQDETAFAVTTSLPLTVPFGETRALELTFDPGGFDGKFLADLELTSNDPFKPQQIVPLEISVAEPRLEVMAPPIFGPVMNGAGPASYSVTIRNTGLGELEITDAYFELPDQLPASGPSYHGRFALEQDFSTGDYVTVAPGESLEIEFTFDPTHLAAGTKRGELSIFTNDPNAGSASVWIEVEVTSAGPIEPAALRHRWSFTDLEDSVGDADALLVGASSLAGGKLVLAGGNGVRVDRVDLPIGETIAALESMTVETWFAAEVANQTWRKLWMFGTSGASPTLSSYTDFTVLSAIEGNPPSSSFKDDVMELTTRAPENHAELAVNQQYHVAVVYDSAADLLSIYLDGTLADSVAWAGSVGDLGITMENYLGAAVHFGDLDWQGTIDEMRIWSGALQAADVAANFAAGTEVVPVPGTNPSTGGAITYGSVGIVDGAIVVTDVKGLSEGETYHLEVGTELNDFVALPGSTFTGGGAVPAVPVSGPQRFVRIVGGPAPGDP